MCDCDIQEKKVCVSVSVPGAGWMSAPTVCVALGGGGGGTAFLNYITLVSSSVFVHVNFSIS